MRIVIAEDQVLCREFLLRLCVSELGLELAGATGDGIEAMEIIRRERPELALLDVQLPGDSGFGIAEKTARELPGTRCVVMSVHCDELTLHRAGTDWIWGFIDKNFGGNSEFSHALREIMNGRRFFSRIFHEARRRRQQDRHTFDRLLTRREQQVLGLIGCALSDDEIAAFLALSPATVETHRRNLMGKLDINCTPKLIRYAIDHGFTRMTQNGLQCSN